MIWRVNSIFCKVNIVHIHCTRNRNLIRIVLVPKRNESLFFMCSVFCQSLNSHSCFIFAFFHRGSFDDLPNQVSGEKNINFTPWGNSRHLSTPPLGSLWNEWAQKFHFDDVLLLRSEVLLIGRANLSLRVVPYFSSGVAERAKRKRAWKSRHARKARRRVSPFLAWGDFHARSRFARFTIPEDKWGTTRSLQTSLSMHFYTNRCGHRRNQNG